MALIKCSECGSEISDKAEICPKCGAPTILSELNYEKEKQKKGTEMVTILSSLLSMVGGIMTISSLITIIKNLDEYSGWIRYGWVDISDVVPFGAGVGLFLGIILVIEGSYITWKKVQGQKK